MSSSTHPHGIIPERGSLRGLLQPNGNAVYIQTAPGQYQAVQPAYVQQYQNRFPNQPMQFRQQHQQQQQHQPQQQQQQQQQRMFHPGQQQQQQQARPGMQMRPGFQSQHLQQSSSAKWHIPQQQGNENPNNNNPGNRSSMMPSINDSFKITLKSQNQDAKNLPATVTSTIPKTPSPNHVQGKLESEHNLDKYCEASVNDLMATIAKLDSNGVQVLAEGRSKTGGSPHVDSSTDDSVAGKYLLLKHLIHIYIFII